MRKKIIVALIICLTICITIVSSVAVYAAISISINEQRTIATSNTNLIIDEETTNYKTLSFSSLQTSFTVTNNGSEACYFDLVILSSTNATITILNQSSVKSLVIEKYNDTLLNPTDTITITVTLSNSSDANIVNVIAVPLNVDQNNEVDTVIKNVYIDSIYDLETSLNLESLNNQDRIDFSHLNYYLIDNLTLTKDLNINIGANLHLLWNNIILNGYTLSINHHLEGLYYIDSISGIIDNSTGSFIVNTPNAFYSGQTSNLSDVTLQNIEITTSSNVDFNSEVFKNALLDEALNYIEKLLVNSYIENSTTKYAILYDLILPNSYFNYDLTYTYSSNKENITSNGHITREVADVELLFTILASYNGTQLSKELNFTIVGTGEETLFRHSLISIENYMSSRCSNGYLYGDIGLPLNTVFGVELSYSIEENIYITIDSALTDNYVSLNIERHPYADREFSLIVSDNSHTGTVVFKLGGLSFEEKEAEFKNLLTDIYVTNTVPVNILSDSLLQDFGLTLEDVDFSLNYYENGVLNNSNSNYNLFSISDNYLSLLSVSSLEMASTDSLEIAIQVTWEEGTTGTYTIQLIVPENGATGDGNASVIANLLQATFNNRETLNTFDDISSRQQGLTISLSIENADISDYCQIEEKIVNGIVDAYSIKILADKVPQYSTTVNVLCTIQTAESTFVHQSYSFTIPGVYQKSRFNSENLYTFLLNNYNDTYPDGDLRSEYLLVREATKEVALLDFTTQGLTALDLKGIEVITNTSEMNFSGIEVTNLSSLGGCLGLTKLNLSNSAIDNADLASSSDNYLYTLTNLIELDLSKNNITSLIYDETHSYFYRTLTTLNLSNQDNLENIEGLRNLPNIEEVHLENNKIIYFDELIHLSNLKNVYLHGNTTFNSDNLISISGVSDYSIVYGSLGSVNLCTFVSLTNDGVNIYRKDASNKILLKEDTTSTDLISDNQQTLAYALNSVIYANTTYTATITDFRTTIGSYDLVISALNVEYSLDTNNTITIESYETIPANIEIILSITFDSTTVYRHVIIEKGAA